MYLSRLTAGKNNKPVPLHANVQKIRHRTNANIKKTTTVFLQILPAFTVDLLLLGNFATFLEGPFLKDQGVRWIRPGRQYILIMTLQPHLLKTLNWELCATPEAGANTTFSVQHSREQHERPYVNVLKSTPDILPSAAAFLHFCPSFRPLLFLPPITQMSR